MFRRLTGAAVAAVLLSGTALAASAAWAAPAVEAYGRLPYIHTDQFKLSASGGMIAFVARGADGASRTLAVRDLATGAILAQAVIGDSKIRNLEWAGDDYVLLTTSAAVKYEDENVRARGEYYQVVSLNVKTGRMAAMFSKDKKILPTVFGQFGTYQVDGHWYGYFEGLTMQGSGTGMADFDQQNFSITPGSTYDLYAADLETGGARRVVQGSRNLADWALGPDGKVLAYSYYDAATGRWVLYGPDGRAELMSVDSPLADTSLVGRGRTPGTVLVVSQDADDTGFFEINVDNRNRVDLLPGQSSEERLTAEDGSLVGARVYGDNDRVRSQFFDPAVQAAYDKASRPFKGLTVNYVSADASWKKWILKTEGAGDSGTFWMVDLTTKKAEQVASAYPDIAPADVAAISVVKYKAQDGTELQGVLTLPNGREAKNLPVVILPHGGPEARDSLHFDWMAQAFASRGYAVFQPNFRGSSGFDIAFLQAGWGQWGRKMQTDVSDGLAALAEQGIVDPKRACIVGASYGGYAALAGVTMQKGIYRCAVSYAGLADLGVMLRDDKGANPTFRSWKTFLGAKSLGDPVVKQYSPAFQAKNADAPILLIHGRDDTVVPIQQSKLMQDALKDAHKPYEYVEVAGDHWLSDEPSRTAMIRAAVAFVLRNNPPD